MQDQLQKVAQSASGIPMGQIITGVVILVVIAVAVVVIKRLTARKVEAPEPPPNLKMDVASLPRVRPPMGGPTLHCVHVPVRLAVLVLAPAGRIRELPPREQLSQVVENIVPGLSRVLSTHAPLVRYWPGQMAVRGFANTFFTNVKLPGDGGKGTPWCSVAGVFKVDGQPMMAGLVMTAETPANIGQIVVERETQWLDFLRVK
jgi:hypothetical protein